MFCLVVYGDGVLLCRFKTFNSFQFRFLFGNCNGILFVYVLRCAFRLLSLFDRSFRLLAGICRMLLRCLRELSCANQARFRFVVLFFAIRFELGVTTGFCAVIGPCSLNVIGFCRGFIVQTRHSVCRGMVFAFRPLIGGPNCCVFVCRLFAVGGGGETWSDPAVRPFQYGSAGCLPILRGVLLGGYDFTRACGAVSGGDLGAGGRFVVNGNVLTFKIFTIVVVFLCVSFHFRHGTSGMRACRKICGVRLAGDFTKSDVTMCLGSDLLLSRAVPSTGLGIRVGHFTRSGMLVIMSGGASGAAPFGLGPRNDQMRIGGDKSMVCVLRERTSSLLR